MASMFIKHRVADFDAWKPIFDEHEATRVREGTSGHSLHRDVECVQGKTHVVNLVLVGATQKSKTPDEDVRSGGDDPLAAGPIGVKSDVF